MLRKGSLLLLIFFFSFQFINAQCTLTVVIKNIKKAEGKIEVGLYDGPENWLEETGQYYEEILDCTSSPEQTIIIENVAYGTYGFSLYQDENGNGEMDFRTWIPKEPYGFSNNPRAKWSKPSFKKCSFDVNQAEMTIEVDLYYW